VWFLRVQLVTVHAIGDQPENEGLLAVEYPLPILLGNYYFVLFGGGQEDLCPCWVLSVHPEESHCG